MTVTITPTKLYAVALWKAASHSPHPAPSDGIPLVDILRRAALLPRSNLVYHAICAQDTLSPAGGLSAPTFIPWAAAARSIILTRSLLRQCPDSSLDLDL
jgi:hypothetical protein